MIYRERTRDTLGPIAVALVVAACTVTLLARYVHAGTDPAPGDGQQVAALIDLLMTGRYIPAVGVFLIAVVAALRGGLGAWIPWFKTKAGGYVLGFGTAALLYVGTAMQAGQLSFGVFAAALGAGWASAGGWEHLGDLVAWLRPPAPKSQLPVAKVVSPQGPFSTTIVLGVILGGMISAGLATQACGGTQGTTTPKTAVIDCTGGNAPGIVANVLATLTEWTKPEADGGCRTATGWDWSCVEHAAIAKGEQVGGCAIAELVQSVLSTTKATPSSMPTESTWLARAALEDYRARIAGGATFRTQRGDI